ncbi:zinc finger and BTB domain-containing protein 24-like isoform X2 [Sitodiplosis mosellana]|nr:zinc finger and BTB domain-containing protein 24-like isoform X2 [Sitodiplosis mosellana]
MSSEEEVYHKSPVKTSAEVASFDKSYDTMNKIKYRDYKCSTCKYTTTEKRLLKTHMLLHELGKHEITSDTLVHTCEHKQMPCYLCNLPKITVKIDIKPNPLLSANNSLECQVCYRKILKKSGMNKHLQAHVDQLKKQSALLGKKEKNFNQKNQRILQLVAIGKKFPFECSKCELPFAEEYDKRAHEELCRRRQYKHLWNFSDVKINKRKILNTKDVKAENTMELKTREGLELEVKIIDAKEEKLIDINMECQDSPAEAPWRPWA